MKHITRTIALTAAIVGSAVTTAHAGGAGRAETAGLGAELAAVRQATAGYHRLDVALEAGYGPFSLDPLDPETPTCFASPDKGGMGVHYVKGIDGDVDAAAPEAMVYALTDSGPQLVAVEYIVPEQFVDPEDPPSLFGHDFHPHSFLPVYILHAWIWQHNPAGMFADFNPMVGPCPTD